MAIRSARDNILAGGFVVGGVIVAVWISFLLGQRTGMGQMKRFVVRFPMSIGAPGIKIGSPVLLGGQKVGSVVGVSFNPVGTTAPSDVDVRVEVPAAITLYDNASVALSQPLLGSLSSINVSSSGSAEGASTRSGKNATIDEGDVITGGLAPPAFLAQAGIGEKQITEIRGIIATLDSGLTKVSGLIDRSAPQAEAGIADARQVIGDLKTKLGEWSKSVDRIAVNFEKASDRIDPILSDAQAGVADARKMIAEVQAIISENKDRINKIVASVESATAKIDQTTVETLNAALRDARSSLDTISVAIGKVSSLISEQTPNLRRTLANLRLMSDNLKLTAIEVRSQPWRALHEPTTKEMSTQALYDATRAYAEAASDVRAASEALGALTAGNFAATPGGAGVDDVSKALSDAMTKYQKAEQQLMDVLIREERK